MNFLRQVRNPTVLPPEPSVPLVPIARDPGDTNGEYPGSLDVWSELLDLSDLEPTEIAGMAQRSVQYMRDKLNALLDIRDGQPSDFNIRQCTDRKGQPYLVVRWHELCGEIGARPLGRCLELFGILTGTETSCLVFHTDFRLRTSDKHEREKMLFALVRRITQRCDLNSFHSILKYTLDQLAEAIDEQRIV